MAGAVIDLDAIQAEMANMSEEDLRKTLLDMKVKEKVNTKKYYNADTAKKQREKATAKRKALIELAKSRGFYDEINSQAAELATAKLAEEAAEGDDDLDTED